MAEITEKISHIEIEYWYKKICTEMEEYAQLLQNIIFIQSK